MQFGEKVPKNPAPLVSIAVPRKPLLKRKLKGVKNKQKVEQSHHKDSKMSKVFNN